MSYVECKRCGFRWAASNARKNVELCASCRARPSRTVVSDSGDRCKPWRGMFADDDVTPVDDDGAPVLPGVRMCGHTDCVNEDHIREWEW